MSESPEVQEPEIEFYEEFGATPTSYVDIPAIVAGLSLYDWELWVTTIGKDRVVPVTRADMWELVDQLRAWKEERKGFLQ